MTRMHGKTVVLREFRWDDLAAMRAWITDTDSTRYLSGVFQRPQTYEETERFLRDILEGNAGGIHFVIADAETLAYLGQCDLMMIDNLARKAELAIVLSPEQTGRGYGREAISLLLDYAFDQINLNRVYLWVYTENVRAVGLYRSLGFICEGTARSHAYVDGHYADWFLFGILRDEWKNAKVAAEKPANAGKL